MLPFLLYMLIDPSCFLHSSAMASPRFRISRVHPHLETVDKEGSTVEALPRNQAN